jgi:hypothetical protein
LVSVPEKRHAAGDRSGAFLSMMNWLVLLDALFDAAPRSADSGRSGGYSWPLPLFDPRIAREPAMLSLTQCAVGVGDKDGRTGERVAVRFDAR